MSTWRNALKTLGFSSSAAPDFSKYNFRPYLFSFLFHFHFLLGKSILNSFNNHIHWNFVLLFIDICISGSDKNQTIKIICQAFLKGSEFISKNNKLKFKFIKFCTIKIIQWEIVEASSSIVTEVSTPSISQIFFFHFDLCWAGALFLA